MFGTALLVAGCSAEQTPQATEVKKVEAGSAEELLAAEGSWNIVEDKTQPTPVQEHMSAREQVDPRKPGATKNYTKNLTPEGMQEETHFRVLRLERQVSDLREDFSKLLPPLSNLIVSDRALDSTISDIESRQKNLAKQHQAMYEGATPPILNVKDHHPQQLAKAEAQPVPPPPFYQDNQKALAPQAQVKPAAPPVNKAPAPAAIASSGPSVVSVRMGSYPDKTRLVLDLSAASKYSYDVDNNERLLIIDLPGAAWTAEMQKSFAGNPLVKGYSAQSANGGTTVAVELARPAKVTNTAQLAPNATYSAHRIFLDIVGQ